MCDQIAIRAGCASARIIFGSVSLTGFPGIPGSMLFPALCPASASIRETLLSKELLHNSSGTILAEADAMQREIFTQDHDEFRDMVRAFIAKEIAPYHEQWERDGVVSRDAWRAAGRAGLLGIHIEEKYGGGGNPDYRYYVVLNEELARAGATGPMFHLHNDMIGPYFDRLCTPEQRQRWLPGYCSGELIAAIAMTEPGAGSDLQGITTTAVRDGDHYVLNGQKTFISNGQLGDIVLGVARHPLEYRKQPTAFGQPLGAFQHSKFTLAEMATELAVAREFTDRAITEHCAG